MSGPDFVVVGWEVRHSYDVPVLSSSMLGGPNQLELTAEVLCRDIDRHHAHSSKGDIGRSPCSWVLTLNG